MRVFEGRLSASGCQLKEALPYQAKQKKENTKWIIENHTPVALRKMIGGTMYCVRVHFNEDAKETMKDKIKRMLENDVKASQHTA